MGPLELLWPEGKRKLAKEPTVKESALEGTREGSRKTHGKRLHFKCKIV